MLTYADGHTSCHSVEDAFHFYRLMFQVDPFKKLHKLDQVNNRWEEIKS